MVQTPGLALKSVVVVLASAHTHPTTQLYSWIVSYINCKEHGLPGHAEQILLWIYLKIKKIRIKKKILNAEIKIWVTLASGKPCIFYNEIITMRDGELIRSSLGNIKKSIFL